MNVTKQYFRYVSQNIFGLIGTSCYILADTYFIAQAAGTDGVAMLNLCLPVYNFIFAFGSMIGLGSATRYAILKAQNDERAHRYFSNGLMCAILIAVPFMLVGAFCPDAVLRLMAAMQPLWRWACSIPASSCCSRRSSCATTSFRPLPGTTATPHWPWWPP